MTNLNNTELAALRDLGAAGVGQDVVGMENGSFTNDLQKALYTGYGASPDAQTQAGAYRLESLQNSIKWVTAREENARFYKMCPKVKAKSTVEEYIRTTEVGTGNFYGEGLIPDEYEETIARGYANVRYVGAIAVIPLVTTHVSNVVDIRAEVFKMKTVAIVRMLDQKMFFGNNAQNPLEFDGFVTQFMKNTALHATNLIDMKGQRLHPTVLNSIALRIGERFGNRQNITGWISYDAYSNYVNELIKNIYYKTGETVNEISVKAATNRLANGVVKLEEDVFLKYRGQTYNDASHPKMNTAKTAFAATHASAPTQLDGDTATVTVEDDATSTLEAGTYDYAILAKNKHGVSKAFEVTGKAVAGNQKVKFVLSDNSSDVEATGFEIYRKANGEATTAYLFLNSYAAVGGAATVYDDGSWIPGTTVGMFYDATPNDVLALHQLLPLGKLPLARIADADRYLLKSYSTPILYIPERMVIVKNIGSTEYDTTRTDMFT